MKKRVIAVDLGGTNLRVALVENNKIKKYIKKNTPKTTELIVKEMEDSISELFSKDIKGIGVGSPGPLENGIIKNPPNLPFRNYNLKKELEKKFKKRVVIENDAHCVALAELKLGVKKRNFIVITLGTGIGGGIIINGELYKGRGCGGELGHIVIENGKFFEKIWQEIRNDMKKEFGDQILVKDIIKMNSEKSNFFIERIVDCLSKGIGSIINIFDPEIVVIGGGIRETGECLLEKIRKEVKKYVVLPRKTTIQWSKLEHPGVLGASLLIE